MGSGPNARETQPVRRPSTRGLSRWATAPSNSSVNAHQHLPPAFHEEAHRNSAATTTLAHKRTVRKIPQGALTPRDRSPLPPTLQGDTGPRQEWQVPPRAGRALFRRSYGNAPWVSCLARGQRLGQRDDGTQTRRSEARRSRGTFPGPPRHASPLLSRKTSGDPRQSPL